MIYVSQAPVSQPSPARAEPRLVHAAHEFEAQLLKELLKPLTSSDASADESGSAGALSDYAGEALGRALSERGGFGIAEQIVGHVSQSGNRTASAPVTTGPQVNKGREIGK